MQLVENSMNPLLSQDEKTLSGLFAEMDTFNQNGRRYPEDIYTQAYEELIPKINERRLLGELDHPIDYDEIRLSNVSHAITECHLVEEDGIKKVYGTIELLDTPAGMIAQALKKAGIPLGISSRGLGATRQVRDGVDVTSLKLITYDLVAEPSFANAILSPDKSAELSDSLHYIESNLPLNESVESSSIRDMIGRIRESLITKKTDFGNDVDIHKAEVITLRRKLKSAEDTVKSDTKVLIEARERVRDLENKLREADEKYDALIADATKIKEAYNKLVESSVSREDAGSMREEIIELKRNLAVEKRGMSYNKVSELLEGANTDSEIESRLNSISSLGRKRETKLLVENTQTKSDEFTSKKLKGLAAIISKV